MQATLDTLGERVMLQNCDHRPQSCDTAALRRCSHSWSVASCCKALDCTAMTFCVQATLDTLGVSADSTFEEMQPQLAQLDAFQAVASEQDRQQIFEKYVAALKVGPRFRGVAPGVNLVDTMDVAVISAMSCHIAQWLVHCLLCCDSKRQHAATLAGASSTDCLTC